MANYLTLAEIKAYIWPTGSAPDDQDDTALTAIATAVSREIEGFCGRSFVVGSEDVTRYFTPTDPEYLFLNIDLISIYALKTDASGKYVGNEDIWATTDYILFPENAAADSLPYTIIEVAPEGSYTFPTCRNGVRLRGRFGWPVVPDAIKEACKIQAGRIWNRRGAPFGVVTNPVSGEMRVLRELDPDVQALISPYKRYV